MAEETENIAGQPVQAVQIAFSQDELSACEKCGRDNAPNRTNCIYCGAELVVRDELISQVKVVANDLEPDALGWTIVAKAKDLARSAAEAELLSLGFSLGDAKGFPTSDALLPIARFSTENLAELARKRLNDIPTAIVSDESLGADKPGLRISKLELDGGVLTFNDFNRGVQESRPVEDLTAVVLGHLQVFTTTTFEKRGMRKRSTVTDESSDVRDSQILDIYFRGRLTPLTIRSTGFDFSTLGSERSLLAAENFERLIAMLRRAAPQARSVVEHADLQNILSGPWPAASRTDGLGRVRTGIGQRRYGRSSTMDNTLQFTKFSRLQALDLDELKR